MRRTVELKSGVCMSPCRWSVAMSPGQQLLLVGDRDQRRRCPEVVLVSDPGYLSCPYADARFFTTASSKTSICVLRQLSSSTRNNIGSSHLSHSNSGRHCSAATDICCESFRQFLLPVSEVLKNSLQLVLNTAPPRVLRCVKI